MATLQKIRSKGPLLLIVIGIALLAFILGDAWRLIRPNQGVQYIGSIDGKKISAMRENASVSFEMDCAHQLISGNKPCAFSFAYQSLMGQGRVQFLETDQEKLAALQQIMLHQTGQTFPASDYNLAKVLLFKLIVEKISAKKSH